MVTNFLLTCQDRLLIFWLQLSVYTLSRKLFLDARMGKHIRQEI